MQCVLPRAPSAAASSAEQRDRALALQQYLSTASSAAICVPMSRSKSRKEIRISLRVRARSAPRGVLAQRRGLFPVSQGMQLQHDPMRGASADPARKGEPRGRRFAARGEQAACAAHPVPGRRGDLSRIVRRATSSTAAASSPAARFSGVRRPHIRSSAPSSGRPAKARRRCVLPLPPDPRQRRSARRLERLLSGLSAAPFFPGEKFSSVGGGRGELEQELLHRSMPPQAGGGHFQLKSGRKHATYLQPPVLNQQEADHLPRRRSGHRCRRRAGEAIKPFAKRTACGRSARRDRRVRALFEVSRNFASRAGIGHRRRRPPS